MIRSSAPIIKPKSNNQKWHVFVLGAASQSPRMVNHCVNLLSEEQHLSFIGFFDDYPNHEGNAFLVNLKLMMQNSKRSI